jgi:hypothetical protein
MNPGKVKFPVRIPLSKKEREKKETLGAPQWIYYTHGTHTPTSTQKIINQLNPDNQICLHFFT